MAAARLDVEAALRHLRSAEPRLRTLIERHGPPRLQRTRNSFQSLARSIIYQQLSGKAAATIYRRFLQLFPTHRFPTPAAVRSMPVARLRSAGLSRQKATCLHALARNYLQGDIRPRRFNQMSAAEITVTLTRVKGIGPWTADMFMIFALNRPDVLPVGDLGVRKGMQRLCTLATLPDAETMRRVASPWRPFRSAASWYLWRMLDEQPVP
jgi:3-methyladenine DNA glycosylase/8-oxoguanine DNA glycosylase